MDIIQLISSLGFPIVACVFVAVYTSKQTDNYRNDIKELQRDHKEEIGKLTEALNNNTTVMIQIKELLDLNTKEEG